jgi:hypothetical protein
MTPREPSLREAAEAPCEWSDNVRWRLEALSRRCVERVEQLAKPFGGGEIADEETLAAMRWYRQEADDIKAAIIEIDRLALSREDVVPEGWVVVPREPTEAMVTAALGALTEWRKGLSADEAILRRSAPIESGRVWLASATPEEKAVIRYRAMIASAPTTHEGA